MRGIRSTSAALALTVAFTAGAWSLYAAQGQGGSSSTSPERSRPASQTGSVDSREFINAMTIAGLAEVQLGKMALERAANAEVKTFGQMMVNDHSKANEELASLARKMNVQPPTDLDQKHKDLASKLGKLKGAEFDREYIMAMVQGHEGVMAKLRERAEHPSANRSASRDAAQSPPPPRGSQSAPRPSDEGGADHGPHEQALTQWAVKALPTVQKHLDQARMIEKSIK